MSIYPGEGVSLHIYPTAGQDEATIGQASAGAMSRLTAASSTSKTPPVSDIEGETWVERLLRRMGEPAGVPLYIPWPRSLLHPAHFQPPRPTTRWRRVRHMAPGRQRSPRPRRPRVVDGRQNRVDAEREQLLADVRIAYEHLADLRLAYQSARDELSKAVRRANEGGYKYREIGASLGMSRQRADQLAQRAREVDLD